MTLKFNALNIFILILYGILDFYFLDFRIAWNFFIIIIVIISCSGFFLIVTYVKRFWTFYNIVLALYKLFIIIIITISY